MNGEFREKGNSSYITYIVIGALYVLIKIVFVSAGYLHPGAILHGLIPATFTVGGGIMALKEGKKSGGKIWHKLILVFPVLIFTITPIYMYLKEKENWLINGRKEVLIIYEIMAIIQFIIAMKQLKNTGK